MAELREAPSTDGAIFPMGLGPAVAQVGAAEQGPAVELGQAERGPAEQGPAVVQVELGAVAELGPAEQGSAVAQVGAAELGPELGASRTGAGPGPVSESIGRALLTRVYSKQILSFFCRDLQG